MPKIYITKFHPNKLISKWTDLESYYLKKTNINMIYSDEGIYTIRNNRLFRLFPIDIPPKILDGGFTIDNSSFVEKEVDSQLPYDHIHIHKDLLHFCVGKRSGIHLVVEGTYNNSASVMTTTTIEQAENKYHNFTPSDMYFVTQEENIDNKLFIQEVNEL